MLKKQLFICVFTLYSLNVDNISLAQNLAQELEQQQSAAKDFSNQKRRLREIFFKDSKVFSCRNKINPNIYGYVFFYEKKTELPSNISVLLNRRIGSEIYGNANFPTFTYSSSINGSVMSTPIVVKSPADVPDYLIQGNPSTGYFGKIDYPEYYTSDQKARIQRIQSERKELEAAGIVKKLDSGF
jgi:hypothetical protein